MTDGYARLSIHRWMLADAVRNEAYREALEKVVREGDAVLDMGAGTGFLSLLAAKAGARRVYAIERTDIAAVARKLIERNGMSDRITVIQNSLEDIELDDRVDVIVSEWMGGFGVDENMLAPLVIARDRFLRPGGRIVPERVTALLAPMWLLELDESQQHWREHPHGVDLSLIAELGANEAELMQWAVTEDDMLAPAQPLWSHDAMTVTLEEADNPFVAKLSFTTTKAGQLSGLATWFDADMGEGVKLTNAIGAPDTHWGRLIFPLDHAIPVREGASIEVELRCEPSSQGACEMYWSVRVDGGPLEQHDTRPRRAAAFPRV